LKRACCGPSGSRKDYVRALCFLERLDESSNLLGIMVFDVQEGPAALVVHDYVVSRKAVLANGRKKIPSGLIIEAVITRYNDVRSLCNSGLFQTILQQPNLLIYKSQGSESLGRSNPMGMLRTIGLRDPVNHNLGAHLRKHVLPQNALCPSE